MGRVYCTDGPKLFPCSVVVTAQFAPGETAPEIRSSTAGG